MKKVLAILMILFLTLETTSCGNNNKQVTDVNLYDVLLVIADNSAIGRPFDLLGNEALQGVVKNRGRIILLGVGGEPFIDQNFELPNEQKGVSESTKERNDDALAYEIAEYVKTIRPNKPEVDLISSFILASKMISQYPGEKKAIVIIGPAVFTSGPISLSYLMTHDTGTVIQLLKEQHCIPDFKGVSIIIEGLGECAGKQSKPGPNDEFKLREFYETYFHESGSNDVEFVTNGINEEFDYNDFPDVTPYVWPNLTSLGEDTIQFRYNSSEFIDENKAIKAIETAAAGYSLGDLLLVAGFASSDGDSIRNMELSLERAKKVSDVLTNLGFNTEVVGKGFDPRYCIEDMQLGKLDETLALENRKVLIMRANSEEGLALID